MPITNWEVSHDPLPHRQRRGSPALYREAGDPQAPTLVLLPGFPSSSHQYRRLVDTLRDELHLIAPGYPGFGYSASPSVDEFDYSFDRLAEATERLLLGELGLKRFFLYVFDFGAPIGFRIAACNPDRIAGLVIQNGNAYEAGLGPMMDVQKAFWADRDAVEPQIRELLTLEVTRSQYTTGA